MNNWLIYGANGYTGELIAREAARRGMRPILAGRHRERIAALANELHLAYRVADLNDQVALDACLHDAALILHCAGPFAHTAQLMLAACLRQHAHYMDITGEIEVFEAAAAFDAEAKAAQVMVLPGAGFDVVPTDCLAAILKTRLPEATDLTLAFRGLGHMSRGTTLTGLEGMAANGMIRRNGQLMPVPLGWKTRLIDFGRGPVLTVVIPWGDVATAYYSTGIPNIEVYTAFPKTLIRLMQMSRYLTPVLRLPIVQSAVGAVIARQPSGPTDEQRAGSNSAVWGEVRAADGRTLTARFTTPNGYTLTVLTTLKIVEAALTGHAPIGFQTPSRAYGADFIFSIEGVTKLDYNT